MHLSQEEKSNYKARWTVKGTGAVKREVSPAEGKKKKNVKKKIRFEKKGGKYQTQKNEGSSRGDRPIEKGEKQT